MWLLRSPDREGEALTLRVLPGNEKTIGRSTIADFIVDVAMVSRVHCRLSAAESGALEVEDLDSTNGTFVNDERVTRAPLRAGDRLRIGRLELNVIWGPES
jgi:pSer/pThr/pTyr-binding forkhead associated (FHA) protein